MGDSSVCTACGAMLPLPDLAGLVTCPSCGRVTRAEVSTMPPAPSDPGAGSGSAAWPAPPVAAPNPADQWAAPAPIAGAPSAPPPSPSRPSEAAGTARKIGCGIVPIVVVVVVALVVVSAVRSCDVSTPTGSGGSYFNSNSNVLTLSGSSTVLSSDADATDLVVVSQETGGSSTQRRLSLVRFTPDGSEERWRSEVLDESIYRAEVAEAGDTLFAAYDDVLLALDRETGETRWRATLRDKVTTGCPDCFEVVDGHLIVRTTDAYVAAYDTGSAEPMWTKRLRSTQGSVSVANGRLFVVDEPEASSQATQVLRLDPGTGRVESTVAPTCPEDDDTPWALEMSPGDHVRAVPGSDDVVAIFGFGDGCAIRWAPDTGTPRWGVRIGGSSSFSQDEVLMGDEDLVAPSTSSQAFAIALDDGAAQVLEGPLDTTVTPVQIVGRTLLGASSTNRGTPKRGLVAWDLASGERSWAVRLPGDPQPVSGGTPPSSDALFDDSPRFVVQPTPDGANVVTFEGEQRTFSFAPLDLATGSLGPSTRRGLLTRYDSGTISLTVEWVAPERLLVSADTALQALPPNGRGPVVGFPDGD